MSPSRLADLARGAPAVAAETPPAVERCDLCGEPVPEVHRHLLDVEAGRLMCTCTPCRILFDRGEAGGGHFRLVPDRCLRLDDLALDDALWDGLRIPVDMAFFFRSSRAGRVVAFYPSPMGATESQLALDAWEELVARNPGLAAMQPDVEALLVSRVGGERRHWLVGVDACYALVGLMRTHWRGLSGGREVWREITAFFAGLDRRATTTREEPTWPT